jgi:predicted DNA-binding protein
VITLKKKAEKIVSVRLPISLYKELEELGKAEERTVSQYVRLAVREYIERRKKS